MLPAHVPLTSAALLFSKASTIKIYPTLAKHIKKKDERCVMRQQNFSNKNLIAQGYKVLYEDTKRDKSVVVYANDKRLVVEKIYSSLGRLIVPIVMLPASLLLPTLCLSSGLSVISTVVIATLSMLLLAIVINTFRFPVDTTDRVIIDSKTNKVLFERERKGRVKVKKSYNTTAVKNVEVSVDSYDNMDIRLDSSSEFVYVVGHSEISENSKMLEVAHKIAEILRVPVIERT
jgi:hypothetical protein